jgi:hypothetical protein
MEAATMCKVKNSEPTATIECARAKDDPRHARLKHAPYNYRNFYGGV